MEVNRIEVNWMEVIWMEVKLSGRDLAVDYLNAWSSTLKTITGDQGRYLAAGLYGYEFANVAEIMRTYDGWAEADIRQFQDMLVTVLYPLSRCFLREHNDACISNYWANWDLANIAGIQAIGVFADRPNIYQEAMDYLYTGEGNGALDNHYVNRLGIAALWTEKMAERQRPERSSWGGDELGWGTLTETLEPAAVGGAPRGLTSELNDGSVVLSWWGAAGAESYRLKRAGSPDGSYSTVATRGAGELLTYTDTDVVEGEDYYYQVTAISSEGESEASNTITERVGTQLLVHFPFDAAKGGRFAASVFDPIIATPGNEPTLVPGKLGNAVALDGVDDYLSLPDGIVSGLADFSIASWVYIDKTTDMARLFDFGFGTQRYMALVPRNRGNQMCFFITKISFYADQTICGNSAPVGEWAHRNDNMVLAPFRLGVTTQNWLGDSQHEGDALLAAKIDDFRIYSGALTTSDLAILVGD